MSNTLPYDVIKSIIYQLDVNKVTGDPLLDRFLIKTCEHVKVRRLFNAFIRDNSFDSLCLLLFQHRRNVHVLFDVHIVLNAIEYTIKKGQHKMTIMLLCKFQLYCKERWTNIVRLCCLAMCNIKDSKGICDICKLLNYIIDRVRPHEQCNSRFALPINTLWKLLSHDHSSIIIPHLMQHKLLLFLHDDFCKCEKIIYHIVCYNHVYLYNYLPDGEYKQGLGVLTCAVCISNQHMLHCVLQNIKLRHYTIGFMSYLVRMVHMNNKNIELLHNVVFDGKTISDIKTLARGKQVTSMLNTSCNVTNQAPN